MRRLPRHRTARQLALTAAVATALGLFVGAGAASPTAVPGGRPVRVVLAERPLVFDVPPVMVAGRILVPFRHFLAALGARVDWDGEGVTARLGDTELRLWPGRRQALVNGAPVELDVPPSIVRGRVLVPLRFVSETLGMNVSWDDATRTVTLTPPDGLELPEPSGRVILGFVGDILLGARVAEAIAAHGVHYPWDGVRDVFLATDIVLGNLETPVSTRGTPEANKQWTFRSHPSTLEGLAAAGVTVVNLANNHVLDYGAEALIDTLDHLDAYGIGRVGAGRTRDEAMAPVVLERHGVRVGILGLAQVYPFGWWAATDTRPGVAITHNETLVMQAVRRLRQQVDLVVVTVHWGEERAETPTAYQQRYGRKLVEAGAHLVIGHHPHVLQGIELYRDGLIAYSLGNFVFPFTVRATQETAILRVTAARLPGDAPGGAIIEAAEILPVFTHGSRPQLLAGDYRLEILRRIQALSAPWGTGIDERGLVRLVNREP